MEGGEGQGIAGEGAGKRWGSPGTRLLGVGDGLSYQEVPALELS